MPHVAPLADLLIESHRRIWIVLHVRFLTAKTTRTGNKTISIRRVSRIFFSRLSSFAIDTFKSSSTIHNLFKSLIKLSELASCARGIISSPKMNEAYTTLKLTIKNLRRLLRSWRLVIIPLFGILSALGLSGTSVSKLQWTWLVQPQQVPGGILILLATGTLAFLSYLASSFYARLTYFNRNYKQAVYPSKISTNEVVVYESRTIKGLYFCPHCMSQKIESRLTKNNWGAVECHSCGHCFNI